MLGEKENSIISLLVAKHVKIESKISLSKEIYKLYVNATNTNLKCNAIIYHILHES